MSAVIESILLVEDEFLISMATKMILERNGYSVITASTGEEAIEKVEQDPSINMILMDINLGDGIDGTEAAKADAAHDGVALGESLADVWKPDLFHISQRSEGGRKNTTRSRPSGVPAVDRGQSGPR